MTSALPSPFLSLSFPPANGQVPTSGVPPALRVRGAAGYVLLFSFSCPPPTESVAPAQTTVFLLQAPCLAPSLNPHPPSALVWGGGRGGGLLLEAGRLLQTSILVFFFFFLSFLPFILKIAFPPPQPPGGEPLWKGNELPRRGLEAGIPRRGRGSGTPIPRGGEIGSVPPSLCVRCAQREPPV